MDTEVLEKKIEALEHGWMRRYKFPSASACRMRYSVVMPSPPVL